MSAWYWCLDHQRVEPEQGCPNHRRLGPYATQEEAAGAIELARARTEEWDAQDRAEDDWDDDH
ncbi:MAG TPA: SPOR domain-containing protein [Jiangellaceae bacterium]|nr:SPOR domain-containing protein [Jiangellaceae bacterium]